MSYVTGIDEIIFLNESEFRDIYSKWKKYNAEMNELQNNPKYQSEILSYKSKYLPIIGINSLLRLIRLACSINLWLA